MIVAPMLLTPAVGAAASHGHAGPLIFQVAGMLIALASAPLMYTSGWDRVVDRIGSGKLLALWAAVVLGGASLAVVAVSSLLGWPI